MSSDKEKLAVWVKNFKQLDTPRLTVRPLRMDDDAALYDVMKDPRVNKWISGFAQPFNLSAMRKWMAHRIARMERGEGLYGAICYRDNSVIMGFMHAVWEDEYQAVEGAAALGELYWGKGFAEEMGFATICDLFDAGIENICATMAPGNYSSMRGLTAFNFVQSEGKDVMTPQGPRPSLIYRLDKERFRKAIITPSDVPLSAEEQRERRQQLMRMCQDLKSKRAGGL